MSLSRIVLLKNKRLSQLISFALQEGWQVRLTPKGNLVIKRKGFAPIYNAAYLLEKSYCHLERHLLIPRNNTNNTSSTRGES